MDMGKQADRRATVVSTVVSTAPERPKRQRKPAKPYPEFPLYAHAGGVWAKRIRGREHYFGPWGDPDAALERYLEEKDFLHAGEPPPHDETCTLDELVNRYLAAQRAKRDSGEISAVHLADCIRDGRRILDCLGRTRPIATLTPMDFGRLRAAAMAAGNATTASGIIIRQRSVFRWGHTSGLLPEEVRYGGTFALPSAKARRRALRANGPRDLSAAEIRQVLAAAATTGGRGVNLQAMILLGINAALGNADCARLRMDHLDLDAAILDYPRPKTEAPRRAVLWPRTVEAIRVALRRREAGVNRRGVLPAELAQLVFITAHRRPYASVSAAGTPVDTVGMEFRRLLADCDLARKGLGFYALRHSFRTVADETRDFPAVDLVMGHLPDNSAGAAPFAARMGARYRQRIGNDRLAAIAAHVEAWLFPTAGS